MRKSLLAAALMLGTSALSAEVTTVKQLYTGQPVAVTWANTLTIPAEDFAEDVKIGNYIFISLEDAKETIEIKANGTWLPGSRYCPIENATEFKAYITTGMLEALKTYGLEICGSSFTVKSVSVMDDGFVMPENAIWGGFFWIENWNTLEIWKTAFDNYNNEKYMTVNLSGDNGDNTGYFMKAMTSWADNGVWADNSAIDHQATYAAIDLQGINVKESLESTDRVMIQANPEGGNPFNITSVVLGNTSTSAIETVNATQTDATFPASVYNLQGIHVTTVMSADEVSSLPAGLYIINGKKHLVR